MRKSLRSLTNFIWTEACNRYIQMLEIADNKSLSEIYGRMCDLWIHGLKNVNFMDPFYGSDSTV